MEHFKYLIIFDKQSNQWCIMDFRTEETQTLATFDQYADACIFLDQLELPN